MDNEDKLKDFLQTSFSGYNHPVKSDLWPALEKELPQRNPVFRKLYQIAASVAAVLILASGLFFLFQKQNNPKPEIFVLEEEKDLNVNEPEIVLNPDFNKVNKILKIMPRQQQIQSSSTSTETSVSDTVIYATLTPEIPDEDRQSEQKEKAPEKSGIISPYEQMNFTPISVSRKYSSGFKVSLAGKNVFAINNSLDINDINKDSYLVSYSNVNSANKVNSDKIYGNESPFNENLINIDYKLPVNISLLVRKNLSQKWAVETGLSYTCLASQETWNLNGIIENNDIELHYLGIPLKASYTFYDNRQWSVYLAGGGMLEKSVYGIIRSKEHTSGIKQKANLEIPELQFSLMGNVGVTYRIAGPLGIFIEPGFSYFFDDKSEVMTIRKDKPLTFNLQGGLRFDF